MTQEYVVIRRVHASSPEEAASSLGGTVRVMPASAPQVNQNVVMQRVIAPEPWPMVLIPLKLLSKPGDKGAGDIIARTIGPIGGDAFKSWYLKLFGRSCGCGQRQEVLNQRWPL